VTRGICPCVRRDGWPLLPPVISNIVGCLGPPICNNTHPQLGCVDFWGASGRRPNMGEAAD
jgi:hypothetical protein